jgi:hypothetical protein
MGKTIFGISKSTIEGFLALGLALSGNVTALMAALFAIPSIHSSVWSIVIPAVITFLFGSARVTLAFLTGDAPIKP